MGSADRVKQEQMGGCEMLSYLAIPALFSKRRFRTTEIYMRNTMVGL